MEVTFLLQTSLLQGKQHEYDTEKLEERDGVRFAYSVSQISDEYILPRGYFSMFEFVNLSMHTHELFFHR